MTSPKSPNTSELPTQRNLNTTHDNHYNCNCNISIHRPLTPLLGPRCCSAIPRKFCSGVFPPAQRRPAGREGKVHTMCKGWAHWSLKWRVLFALVTSRIYEYMQKYYGSNCRTRECPKNELWCHKILFLNVELLNWDTRRNSAHAGTFLPFFPPWNVFFYFLGVFPDPMWEVKGQGCHMCSGCKALWGKLFNLWYWAIQNKLNLIELTDIILKDLMISKTYCLS